MNLHTGLVSPPTAALPVWTAPPLLQHQPSDSVDHLLQLLHRESSDRFASWLRLKDARLFGERVDAFSSRLRGLLLELHVQGPCELEGASLLQLSSCDIDHPLDDGLDILGF